MIEEAPDNRDIATKHNLPRPAVVLSDGNVYAIIGACRKAMKKASWPRLAVQEVTDLMLQQGSYDEVLQVVMLNFNVSLEGDVAAFGDEETECPECGRIMSAREAREQKICNDCQSGG